EDIEGAVDDIDGAVHPGAESPGIGQHDRHGRGGHQWVTAGSTARMATRKTMSRPARGWLKSTVTVSSSKSTTTPGSSARLASAKDSTRPASRVRPGSK